MSRDGEQVCGGGEEGQGPVCQMGKWESRGDGEGSECLFVCLSEQNCSIYVLVTVQPIKFNLYSNLSMFSSDNNGVGGRGPVVESLLG